MYNIPRNLLEVYKTDEENSKSSEENKEGFTLHQGDILETYYYSNIIQINNEYDYEDINNNGSITLSSVDKNNFYKGVRLLHRKGWEKYGENIPLTSLPEMLLGFIVEQEFHADNVELTIAGMTKLLEKNYSFDFEQKKISEILTEMINTAGLEPVIDTTGLNDMVIDYSNVSGGGSGDANANMNISEDVKAAAKKICKGKKGAKAKASALTEWVAKNVPYLRYTDYRKSPEETLKSGGNCADTARLMYRMCLAVNLKAQIVHNQTCGGRGHLWVQINIDGTWYDSDPTSNGRSQLNQVWCNCKGTVTAYAQKGMEG